MTERHQQQRFSRSYGRGGQKNEGDQRHAYNPGRVVFRNTGNVHFGSMEHKNRGPAGGNKPWDQPRFMQAHSLKTQPKCPPGPTNMVERENKNVKFPFEMVDGRAQFDVNALDENCVELENLPCFGVPAPIIQAQNSAKLLFEEIGNSRKRKMAELKYSRKVVIGNVSRFDLKEIFTIFRQFKVEEVCFLPKNPDFCYILLEDSDCVERLLHECTPKSMNFEWRINGTTLEVFPWCVEDTAFTRDAEWPRSVRWTVFVGSLPRVCTAGFLCRFFGHHLQVTDVLQVRIDCDPTLYPRGAARVVLQSRRSYEKVCRMGRRKVQWFGSFYTIDFKSFIYKGLPCDECGVQLPTSFCDTYSCLRYFCQDCWPKAHAAFYKQNHRPVQGAYRDIPYVATHYEQVLELQKTKRIKLEGNASKSLRF